MRYHQLFVFSCGTTLRKDDSAFRECKLKLWKREREPGSSGVMRRRRFDLSLDGGCLSTCGPVPDDDRLSFRAPTCGTCGQTQGLISPVAAPGA